ncbi:hypothetical protein [Brevundimonas sp.]|uniref:hypothetical protein n=1 Tax=Brevundimonas sp. TaxID=1871086 RepID=UPI003784EDF4
MKSDLWLVICDYWLPGPAAGSVARQSRSVEDATTTNHEPLTTNSAPLSRFPRQLLSLAVIMLHCKRQNVASQHEIDVIHASSFRRFCPLHMDLQARFALRAKSTIAPLTL